MNETCLINTAKVRWLKSQEIFQILSEPPKGLLVEKIPTKPKNGDIFMLDSKQIKRKWKQDGWTYMPRKQGIGFREDNENLRIGGENAITCYYSYIINGLLEGEEKVIVMNRRIYKLFPEGQYFFVHYLKDPVGINTANSVNKEGQQQLLSNSMNPQQNQTNSQNEREDERNQQTSYHNSNSQSERNEGFDLGEGIQIQTEDNNSQQKSESFYNNNNNNMKNNYHSHQFHHNGNNYHHTQLNSTTISVSGGDYDSSSKQNQYNLNDYTMMNQEDSSQYSNSPSLAPTSKISSAHSQSQSQDTVERLQPNQNYINKSKFSCENGIYNTIEQNSSNIRMEEENEQIQKKPYNGSREMFYNGNGIEREYDQKLDSHILDGGASHNNNQNDQLNQNYVNQTLLSQQNLQYSDIDEWQNMFGHSDNLSYKGNHQSSSSQQVLNKNEYMYENGSRLGQSTNNGIHDMQSLEIEGHFEQSSFYNQNNNQQENFNQLQQYSQNQFRNAQNDTNNEYTGIYNYAHQKQDQQFETDSTQHTYYNQRIDRFISNQQVPSVQKNRNQIEQDNAINKTTPHNLPKENELREESLINNINSITNSNQIHNLGMTQSNNSNGINPPPSYSKLQERILELEQRLHKLEFDKKSEGSMSGSQHSNHSSHPNNRLGKSLDPQSLKNENINYITQQLNIPTSNTNNQNTFNPQQPQLSQQQQYNSSQPQFQQQFLPQQYNQIFNQDQERITKKFEEQHFRNQYNGNSSAHINNTMAPKSTNSQGISNQNPAQIPQVQNGNSESQRKAESVFNNTTSNQYIEQEQEGAQKQQIPQHQSSPLKQSYPGGNNNVPAIKVTEYSPEWDYTKGGSKMVLCFLPALNNLTEYQKSKFLIGFGTEKVPAYCIQPGVLKCFVPPHEKGLVKLQIYLESDRIDDVEDKPSYFEFRNQEKKKKKQTTKKAIFNQDDEFYRNEFKVRIIDKLNSIQDFISQSSTSKTSQQGYTNHQQGQFDSKQSENEEKMKTSLESILDSLRDSLDNLDNQSFYTLLTKILGMANSSLKKSQIKKWIDQIDDNGYSLIHYIVILGFDTSLQILTEYECNLNIQSRNKITPLQLAFALNQEKIVEILIKSGVLGENLNQQLQGGQIKGDIQQLSSLLNFGAIYQSRNILDMLVREVTLHDSINNSSLNDHISWNDQEEQEDNYLDIKDLCEPSNENELIKNLNTISHQLKDLHKRKKRYRRNKRNQNNQEGEIYSIDNIENNEDYINYNDNENDYYDDSFDEDDDDYEEEDDDDDDEDDDDDDEYSQNYNGQQNKQMSSDNLEKQIKKHKYLRNYSEINKQFKEKQRDMTEFDEKDDQLYMSQNYQCRIKTIQKNVRGWLLRRQYLDIKYATRVLQNYIRQRIAKKHIKPECKNMIKNKLIDWLSVKH